MSYIALISWKTELVSWRIKFLEKLGHDATHFSDPNKLFASLSQKSIPDLIICPVIFQKGEWAGKDWSGVEAVLENPKLSNSSVIAFSHATQPTPEMLQGNLVSSFLLNKAPCNGLGKQVSNAFSNGRLQFAYTNPWEKGKRKDGDVFVEVISPFVKKALPSSSSVGTAPIHQAPKLES